jgi:hypothetical protein
MSDSGSAASQLNEINQDIQASLNLIRRDLRRIDGSDLIPSVGIPLPGGNWENNRCIRGGEVVSINCTRLTADDILLLKATRTTNREGIESASGFTLDAITPSTVNGNSAVSIVYVDDYARDIEIASVKVNSLNVKSDVNSRAGNEKKFSAIQKGDFVLLQNGATAVLQYVTESAANTISFAKGPLDPTGVNQANLDTYFKGGNVTVHLLRYVTYYLDADPGINRTARLMRQVNLHEPVQLIPGVTGLNFTYDVVDPAVAPTISEIDISGGGGSRPADYFSGNPNLVNEQDYFEKKPEQVMYIRMVNIVVWDESGTPITPGGDQRVALNQTGRVAVRGYTGKLDPDYCADMEPIPPIREQMPDTPVRLLMTGNSGDMSKFFSFTLEPLGSNSNFGIKNVKVSVSNNGKGFGTWDYEKTGIYEYRIRMTPEPSAGGYTFDTKEYIITDTVTEECGQLILTRVAVVRGTNEQVSVLEFITNRPSTPPTGGGEDLLPTW